MKILQLIDLYQTGGAEKVYDLFSRYCVSKGHGISRTVLYGKSSEGGAEKYLLKNEHSSLPVKLLDQCIATKLMYQTVKKERIDQIVSFLDRSNLLVIFAFLFDRNRPKITVTIHNPPGIQYMKLNKYIRLIFLFVLSWAYNRKWVKVIAVSQAVTYSLARIGVKKIHTVYNPLEIQRRYIMDGESSSDRFVLAVGRLDVQKAHWKLIKAFYYYRKNYQDEGLKLYIAGTGKLEKELKAMCDVPCLRNSVVFLGYRENIFEYITGSECVVFSSFYEGFPVALLECMALQKPFVGSEDSIPVEIKNILSGGGVKNTYRTVSRDIDYTIGRINDDEKELAALINRARTDPDFSDSISAPCHDWFLDNCSVNNFAAYFI